MSDYTSKMWEEIKVECKECGKKVVDQRISLLDDEWRWKEDKETGEVSEAMCSKCFEELDWKVGISETKSVTDSFGETHK